MSTPHQSELKNLRMADQSRYWAEEVADERRFTKNRTIRVVSGDATVSTSVAGPRQKKSVQPQSSPEQASKCSGKHTASTATIRVVSGDAIVSPSVSAPQNEENAKLQPRPRTTHDHTKSHLGSPSQHCKAEPAPIIRYTHKKTASKGHHSSASKRQPPIPPQQPVKRVLKTSINPYTREEFAERIPFGPMKNKRLLRIPRRDKDLVYRFRPTHHDLHESRWKGTPASASQPPSSLRQRHAEPSFDSYHSQAKAQKKAKLIFQPAAEVLDIISNAVKYPDCTLTKNVFKCAREMACETDRTGLLTGYSSIVRACACVQFASGVLWHTVEFDFLQMEVRGLQQCWATREAIVSAVSRLLYQRCKPRVPAKEHGGSTVNLKDQMGGIWKSSRRLQEFQQIHIGHDSRRAKRKQREADQWEEMFQKEGSCREKLGKKKGMMCLLAACGVIGALDSENNAALREVYVPLESGVGGSARPRSQNVWRRSMINLMIRD